MTIIRVRCRKCESDLELDPDEVTLELQPTKPNGHYTFQCSECGADRRHIASSRVVNMLMAFEVKYVLLDPPIDESDIARFSSRMDDPEAVQEALDALSGNEGGEDGAGH